MTSPSTVRVKETVIAWRHLKVVTVQSPAKFRLRPFTVYVADETGCPISPAKQYASLAAAVLAHESTVAKLGNGTMPKEIR